MATSGDVKTPVIFPMVFGLFSLPLLVVSFGVWVRSSRVVIRPDEIHVRHQWLLLASSRVILAADVSEFGTRVGMSSASRNYYDIYVMRKNGRRVNPAAAIGRKVETDMLIGEMKTALRS